MDSTPQDHGVSQRGGRPSLLPPTPSSRQTAGIPLLDAIHPDARGSTQSAPPRQRGPVRVLVLGAVMTVAVGAGWVVATRATPEATPVAQAAPTPTTTPPPARQVAATLPAPAAPSQAAQIVPMTVATVAMAPAPSAALSAQSLAAESLADREPVSRVQAPRNTPAATKPTARSSSQGQKKTAGHAKRARPEPADPPRKTAKSGKARTRPAADPDADVVAAIMASMDRRTAPAAPGKAASSAPAR